jgi:rubrerythrin
MSAGKGSKPRPVDPQRYAANYDAIFRKTPPYPDWICRQCGFSYGRLPDGRLIATYHQDTCGICGKTTSVTEPRDYGHLREWPLVTRHSSPVTSS